MKIYFFAAFASLAWRVATSEQLPDAANFERFSDAMEVVDPADSPKYLFDASVPEGLEATSFGARAASHDNTRRRLTDEYSTACADPDTLYAGTSHTGVCTCDTSFETVDRVLCVLDGLDCSQSVCVQEDDIWLFDKTTGQLISRSTCLRCADTASTCSTGWVDTCFNMDFDGNDDPDSCSLLLANTDPIQKCNTCSPCVTQDGSEGMNFNCFDGGWDSEGLCVISNRLALHPFDENDGSDGPAVIIGGVVVGLVLLAAIGGVVVFCCCRKNNGEAQNQNTAAKPVENYAYTTQVHPTQAYPAQVHPTQTTATAPGGGYAVDL